MQQPKIHTLHTWQRGQWTHCIDDVCGRLPSTCWHCLHCTCPTRSSTSPCHRSMPGTQNLGDQPKFQAAIQEFNLYLNIHLLVKNQILEAVPNCYLEILKDNEDEYNNLTIEQMMTHLNTTYGSISNANLAENLKELNQKWNTNTKLLTIFSHYHKIQLFAADDDPISDKTLLGKATAAICNTGILHTDLDTVHNTFHKYPKAEQTYDNFTYSCHTKYKRKTSLLPRPATKALIWLLRSKTKQKTKVRTTKQESTHSSKDLWYCCYHGIMHAKMTNPDLAHNSNTCKYPAKGHDKTVTL